MKGLKVVSLSATATTSFPIPLISFPPVPCVNFASHPDASPPCKGTFLPTHARRPNDRLSSRRSFLSNPRGSGESGKEGRVPPAFLFHYGLNVSQMTPAQVFKPPLLLVQTPYFSLEPCAILIATCLPAIAAFIYRWKCRSWPAFPLSLRTRKILYVSILMHELFLL